MAATRSLYTFLSNDVPIPAMYRILRSIKLLGFCFVFHLLIFCLVSCG